MANQQLRTDPAVSRAKFAREITKFTERRWEHHEKGWWLIEAAFPKAFFVMTASQLVPASVMFGVEFDFTDYDLLPPSVRLVNPFTRQPYLYREVPTRLARRVSVAVPEHLQGLAEAHQDVPLLMAHSPDAVPFVCVPGTREYHEHSAHTGDSWLLHRGGGEGTLHHLLQTLYRYGVEPVKGYQIGMHISGYATPIVPE